MAKRKLQVTEPVELWDLGKIGIILDQKPHLIPPHAFTAGKNIRFTENGVERFLGHEAIFGTPTVAPFQLLNVPSVAANYWIYAGLTKIYVYDGTNHVNITRQTASVDVNYTAPNGWQWQSTILGGVPILNNGVDKPQYWTGLTVGNKMANLTAFPTNLTAKIVKALGPYLVAFNLLDTGVALPKTIHWSSFADPGTLPASWDYTDPTVDAGRLQLTDDKGGEILDALLLGNQCPIYTTSSTHIMRYVGGIDIFATDLLLKESGILCTHAVCSWKKGSMHFVVSDDDVLVHAGTKDAESIIEKKVRRALFGEIDTTNYRNAFTFENSKNKEVWFCYPTTGETYANKALIWNYRDNTFTFRDLNGWTSADTGAAYAASSELWSDGTDLWDEGSEPWSIESRANLIVASPSATKLYKLDTDGAYGPDTMPLSIVERTGLAIDGKDQDGSPTASIKTVKQLKRVWPKIEGDVVVNISVGSQQYVNGVVSWNSAQAFNPATQKYLDVMAVGPFLAYRVEYTGVKAWTFEGMDFEITVLARL